MATKAQRSITAHGRAIRQLREARGWTRGTLALNAGIGEATICRVELYGTEPSTPVLRKIAAAFDVSVASLLEPTTNDSDGDAA
jgi:transcriptional regulator with XRE-family HTH domain